MGGLVQMAANKSQTAKAARLARGARKRSHSYNVPLGTNFHLSSQPPSRRMASERQNPKHWPAELKYLREPVYHTSVNPEVMGFLRQYGSDTGRSSTRNDDVISRSSHSICTIRQISDVSHPACGQSGLFYTRKLPSRSFVLDYLGEVHTNARLESDYDLSLYRFPDGTSVGIDAAYMGNEARFIKYWLTLTIRECDQRLITRH